MSGKSTLAKRIAEQEKAVLLSTDAIRDWMQSILDREEHPDLFFSSGLTAEQIHKRYSDPQMLLEAQLRQNHEVETAVIGLLRTRYLDWDILVLEGIVLNPEFCIRLSKTLPTVKFETNILAHNDTSLSKRLHDRGVWSEHTKSLRVSQKEEAWLTLYNTYFKEQADKYAVSISYPPESFSISKPSASSYKT